MLLRRHVWLALWSLLGCIERPGGGPAPTPDAAPPDSASPAPSTPDASLEDFAPYQDESLPYRCELGITPAGGDQSFVAFSAGEVIPIAGIGQAGLTARPALRIRAQQPPAVLDEATVQLVLTSLANGATAESRPFDIPVVLTCRDDGACYRGPVLVEISHLAPLPELEGLLVGVSVEVFGAGDELLCRSRSHGVLDRF